MTLWQLLSEWEEGEGKFARRHSKVSVSAEYGEGWEREGEKEGEKEKERKGERERKERAAEIDKERERELNEPIDERRVNVREAEIRPTR